MPSEIFDQLERNSLNDQLLGINVAFGIGITLVLGVQARTPILPENALERVAG
jgi:hypothetical protein